MLRARPPLIRKSLELALMMARNGVEFVPIPVLGEEDKQGLVAELWKRLDLMEAEAKSQEKNHDSPGATDS